MAGLRRHLHQWRRRRHLHLRARYYDRRTQEALRQRQRQGGVVRVALLHPSHKYLYAVSEVADYKDSNSGAVASFALDPATGKLTPLNHQSSTSAGPCHLVVDRQGKNVLVANYGGATAAVLPIGRRTASWKRRHRARCGTPDRAWTKAGKKRLIRTRSISTRRIILHSPLTWAPTRSMVYRFFDPAKGDASRRTIRRP